MIGIHPDCPPSVALLADHLDAALAAGEDLMAASLPARADLDEIDCEAAPEALDAFVRRLQQLESSLLLRVLHARRLAVEIGRADTSLKAIGALFRAQTEALHELILRAGRTPEGGLVRAGDSHAYLRSRGLIAPEAAAPSPFESLAVSEGFRVGGVGVLSQILDLVSSVLDLLDARFGLYAPDLADETAPTPVEHGPVALAGADGEPLSLNAVIAAVTGKEAASERPAGLDEPATAVAGMPVDDGTAVKKVRAAEAEAAKSDKAPSIELEQAKPAVAAAEASDGATGTMSDTAGAATARDEKSSGGTRSLVSLVAEVGPQP